MGHRKKGNKPSCGSTSEGGGRGVVGGGGVETSILAKIKTSSFLIKRIQNI